MYGRDNSVPLYVVTSNGSFAEPHVQTCSRRVDNLLTLYLVATSLRLKLGLGISIQHS